MVINSSLLGKAVKVIISSEDGPKKQIMIFQGLTEGSNGLPLTAILEDEKGRLLYASTACMTFIDVDDEQRQIDRYKLKPIPLYEFANASFINHNNIFDDSKNKIKIVDMKAFKEWNESIDDEETKYVAIDERGKTYKVGDLYWYGRN